MRFHPLRRSVFFACVLFFLTLSLLLSVVTYRLYTDSMYSRYRQELTSVANFLETQIDNDDMAECARTYVASEKHQKTQEFLDNFIDQYTDLHYVYLMQVLPADAPVQIKVIITANSTWEKENAPEDVVYLGDGEADWYSPAECQKFREVKEGKEDAFFENESSWGIDYTLSRPMFSSDGECYGLLCLDIALEELNQEIYRNIYINIGLIFGSAIVFILLLLLWMRHNVTGPLRALEKSVSDFARNSDGKTNPDELRFQPPVIKVHNEVLSLSNAMTKLSDDMRDYVTKVLATEREKQGLQTQVFQDPLTKVKSIAAYRVKTAELTRTIQQGGAEFSIVMVDINNLKQVNDQYGHENGDKYIIGAIRLVCKIFASSPVYRIGGDEFVVVLTGNDYKNRETLYRKIKSAFAQSADDTDVEPWHRYSAAVGMSIYCHGDDVSAVFERADHAMYEEKDLMKVGRTEWPSRPISNDSAE